MKATGRRAWRKLCKSMRKREGSAYPADVARRNRKRPGFVDMRGPESFKPFTPRSLVGMTMGARKRAAWYEAVRAGAPPIRSNRKLRLCLKWLPQAVLSATVSLKFRQEIRTKYRIGQRLRPCQGCTACVTQMQDWSVDGAWVAGQAVRHREGCSHDDPTGYCCFGEIVAVPAKCDGSGVLPAKRSGFPIGEK